MREYLAHNKAIFNPNTHDYMALLGSNTWEYFIQELQALLDLDTRDSVVKKISFSRSKYS